MKNKGILKDDTAVVTVMTNMGFKRFAEANEITVLETKVGDRYVLEEMLKHDYKIGGEQSGHIIFKNFATTATVSYRAQCSRQSYHPRASRLPK